MSRVAMVFKDSSVIKYDSVIILFDTEVHAKLWLTDQRKADLLEGVEPGAIIIEIISESSLGAAVTFSVEDSQRLRFLEWCVANNVELWDGTTSLPL